MKKRVLMFVLAVVLVLTFVLTACSDGSEPNAPTESELNETAPLPVPDPEDNGQLIKYEADESEGFMILGSMFADFEDGGLSGFMPHGGAELTVTPAQSYNSKYSLQVKTSEAGQGATLDISECIIPGTLFRVSARVFVESPEEAEIELSFHASNGDHLLNIPAKELVQDDWTKVTGYYYANDDSGITNMNIIATESAEFYIDDVTFTKHLEVNEILQASIRLPSLKDIYKDHFQIGILTPGFYNENAYRTHIPLICRHFNAMVNAIGPAYQICSKTGEIDFNHSDVALHWYGNGDFNFTFSYLVYPGPNMKPNPLYWWDRDPIFYTQTPDGKPITRAEAIVNMEEYINNMVGHYKGQVYSWGVTNETMMYPYHGIVPWRENLFTDTYWDSSPMDPHWWTAFENGADISKGECGADYIEMAFRFTRETDPNAILFHCDNTTDNYEKMVMTANMIKEINDKWLAEGNDRLLIEGMGLQAHFDLTTDLKAYERSLKLFADIGVKIVNAEVSISIFGWDGNTDWALIPTEEDFYKQAQQYAELFMIYKRNSDVVECVTFWGLDDSLDFHPGRYPLLFNGDMTPKLAYFAVADPEGFLAGDFDTEEQRTAWIAANSQ